MELCMDVFYTVGRGKTAHEARALILAHTAELFRANPSVHKITWREYTTFTRVPRQGDDVAFVWPDGHDALSEREAQAPQKIF